MIPIRIQPNGNAPFLALRWPRCVHRCDCCDQRCLHTANHWGNHQYIATRNPFPGLGKQWIQGPDQRGW